MTYVCDKCGRSFEFFSEDEDPIYDFLACPVCAADEKNKSAIRCEGDDMTTLSKAVWTRNQNEAIINEVRTKRLQESTESGEKGAA